MNLKMSLRMMGTLKMQSSEVYNDSRNILINFLTLYSFHWFCLCQ
jgi:hypothetical protein